MFCDLEEVLGPAPVRVCPGTDDKSEIIVGGIFDLIGMFGTATSLETSFFVGPLFPGAIVSAFDASLSSSMLSLCSMMRIDDTKPLFSG